METVPYAVIISAISFVVALIVVVYVFLGRKSPKKQPAPVEHKLDRHTENPVISPNPYKEWEVCGTFNPAAFQDDTGQIHILYRAIGGDGLSRVGHASSGDGLSFDERSQYPVYEPTPSNGLPDSAKVSGPQAYNPSFYVSGGGWGGCEDPRAVRIGDRVYMTYVAFEGWSSVRMGVTSIAMEDIKKGRWDWKNPTLISPPGEVNKNWVLFPEKINGKFAILHSISPKILVDYVDNFEYLSAGQKIKSASPRGGRQGHWDNWVRGAGPPPLRTDLGWLLLYHAMDKNDPDKYKLGAMILDYKDPTKVLYRSPQPILSPEMHYENDGKPGVVYASGAIVKDENLMVYYGGGDKHVCVAQTPMKSLMNWLEAHGKVK